MKRNFMSILLALALAVGSAAPAYAGEVFTFEAVPESGSKAEKQSAPVWEAPETERQEPDDYEWTPPEPECVNLDAYAQEVLTLANAQRGAAGLNPLSADPVLTEMAMLRARELEESYSHTRPSGENCKTVFGEFETDLRFWGENAARAIEPQRRWWKPGWIPKATEKTSCGRMPDTWVSASRRMRTASSTGCSCSQKKAKDSCESVKSSQPKPL